MPGYKKEELEPMLQAPGLAVCGKPEGSHAIEFMNLPVGNYEGLLHGLADGCEATHCGYLIKGRMRFTYVDGGAEEFTAGTAFIAPPGHHFEVLEAAELVGFTMVDEDYARMQETIGKNVEGFLQTLA